MYTRHASLLLPYTKDLMILFQNRKQLKKRHAYGFFGGGKEGEETPKETLQREIQEELNIDIKDLEKLEFFKEYTFETREKDLRGKLSVYICEMSEEEMKQIKVDEGKAEILTIPETLRLDISEWDRTMLQEIKNHLDSKSNISSDS